MNNRLLTMFLIMFLTMGSQHAYANPQAEIPLLKFVKMNFNDADPSSKPEIMNRQFEYISSATPEALLKFYQDSEHIESCEYNDMADNYMCKLATHGKVSTGHVFIPTKSKNGSTEIFADYFFYQ